MARYFRNCLAYAVNLPRRPGGGMIVLMPSTRGRQDVVEGDYYAQFLDGILEELPGPPDNAARMAWSSEVRAVATLPVFDPVGDPGDEDREGASGPPPEDEDGEPADDTSEGGEDQEEPEGAQDDPSETETDQEEAEPEEEPEAPVEEPAEEVEEEAPTPLDIWVRENGNLSKTNLKKKLHSELQELAALAGVSTEGTKAELADRIIASQGS